MAETSSNDKPNRKLAGSYAEYYGGVSREDHDEVTTKCEDARSRLSKIVQLASQTGGEGAPDVAQNDKGATQVVNGAGNLTSVEKLIRSINDLMRHDWNSEPGSIGTVGRMRDQIVELLAQDRTKREILAIQPGALKELAILERASIKYAEYVMACIVAERSAVMWDLNVTDSLKLLKDATGGYDTDDLKVQLVWLQNIACMGPQTVAESRRELGPPKRLESEISGPWNTEQQQAVELVLKWLEVPSPRGGPTRDQPKTLRWLIENGPSTHASLSSGAGFDWDDPREGARKMIDRINKRAARDGQVWEIFPENNGLITFQLKRTNVPKTSRKRP